MTSTSSPAPLIAPPGLKGLAVADTALGDVRGSEGFFHYREHDAAHLARTRTLEDVWTLQLRGGLPPASTAIDGGALRTLPKPVAELIDAAAVALADPMATLRVGLLAIADHEARGPLRTGRQIKSTGMRCDSPPSCRRSWLAITACGRARRRSTRNPASVTPRTICA